MSIQINAAAREEIAEYLVSDRVTHRVLDRKFQDLNISEPAPVEPNAYKRSGLIAGVDYHVMRPPKRDRLLRAVQLSTKRAAAAAYCISSKRFTQ